MDHTAPVTTISTKLPPQIHRTARKHKQKDKAIRAASRIARPQPPNTNKTNLDRLPAKKKISPSKILRRSTPSRQPTQNTTDSKPAAYSLHMSNKQSAPILHNKTSTNHRPAGNKNSTSEIPRRTTSSRQPTQNTTDIKPAAYSLHMTNKQSAPTFHNKISTDLPPAKSKKSPSETTRRFISFLQPRQNNPDIKPAPHVSSTTN